jgi:hypothetical protein
MSHKNAEKITHLIIEQTIFGSRPSAILLIEQLKLMRLLDKMLHAHYCHSPLKLFRVALSSAWTELFQFFLTLRKMWARLVSNTKRKNFQE